MSDENRTACNHRYIISMHAKRATSDSWSIFRAGNCGTFSNSNIEQCCGGNKRWNSKLNSSIGRKTENTKRFPDCKVGSIPLDQRSLERLEQKKRDMRKSGPEIGKTIKSLEKGRAIKTFYKQAWNIIKRQNETRDWVYL